MENNRTEILRELEAELASLKEKVQAFEDKLEAFRQLPPEAPAEAPVEEPVEESDFTDIEIGVADLPEPKPVVEDLPEEPVEEPAAEEIPGQARNDEKGAEPVAEPVVEEIPGQARNDEKVVRNDEKAEEPKPAPAAHPETERLPWRLDKPGLSVKNIRSGISLYDRALFIGTLFKEDYALYDRTIGDLNALGSLDEAVDYLLERFPDWNLKSDIVYNFMMAVRKKLG